MAHFVSKFVAMATGVGQGQIQRKGEREGESYYTTAEGK